jgi:membrane-associated phospholipid phosphatase
MGDLGLLLWLRAHATPWLDALMGGITYLGSEYFYLAALSVLYWCVDTAGTLQLFILFLGSSYLNAAVKEITALPRPFQVHPELSARFTETATDYAFPSGHAQSATVFWGYLGLTVRRRWIVVLAPVVVFLVAFSRLYLGLHWLRDVVGGVLFGLVLLGCAYVLLRALAGMRSDARFPASLLFCLLPLAFYLLFPSHEGAQTMGAAFGALFGYLVERHYVRFRVSGAFWQQALKGLVGLSGAFLLLFGLRALFAPFVPAVDAIRVRPGMTPPLARGFLSGRGAELFTFIRYSLVGLWATLGAPALFRLFFGQEDSPRAAV